MRYTMNGVPGRYLQHPPVKEVLKGLGQSQWGILEAFWNSTPPQGTSSREAGGRNADVVS